MLSEAALDLFEPAPRPKLREKKCRHCREPFAPERSAQVVCGPDCAVALMAAQRARQERIEKRKERAADRLKAEQLKPLRKLLSEAQSVFNAFIRERDKKLPCVSCGRFHKGAHDAGHYVSGAANPWLRFDEANVHRQCVPCNHNLSGNLLNFRKGLLQRIGEAELHRLEHTPAPVRKWTREELAALKATYSAKLRELVKAPAQGVST